MAARYQNGLTGVQVTVPEEDPAKFGPPWYRIANAEAEIATEAPAEQPVTEPEDIPKPAAAKAKRSARKKR
jgi:hypothetical protein